MRSILHLMWRYKLHIGLVVLLTFFVFALADLSDDPIEARAESTETEDPVEDSNDLSSAFISSRQGGTCENDGCHKGIEPINEKMTFSCVLCHAGDDTAGNMNISHDGMYPNPADFDVVEETCAKCHSDEYDRVRKSLHSSSAGVISGTRYSWGVQDRDSLYGNRAVTDADTKDITGALDSLALIPTFTGSGEPVDDYLRNQCLRCHVNTEGAKRDGDYRSSGCAACHMVFADDGLYKGSDPTIPKDEKDHAIKHEITTQIPAEQCVHCHNRGGRTGVSFIGTMESDGYGSPYTEGGGKQGKLHGKSYNHLSPDVHYEKGMQCIDCHTQWDVMGDGNIYGKKEEAVEIECTDCHGTPKEYPWNDDGKVLTSGAVKSDGTRYGTAGGHEFPNIRKEGDSLILTSKYDGVEHTIPLLKEFKDNDNWPSTAAETAMSAVPHLDSLECFACHAVWAPQCYGCHAKLDAGQTGYDWVAEDQLAKGWQESRSYLRWEDPVLGINAEGLVSPYIPGCQVFFTYIDENGNSIEVNKVYTTVDGTSGVSTNPIQPHTINGKARPCESCHTMDKALGLGSGYYDPEANDLPIDFELERIVDEDGNQIQGTAHHDARPFNKEEQNKISRVGLCFGCHQAYDDPIWKSMTDAYGFADTEEQHTKVMAMLLKPPSGDEPVLVLIAMDGRDSKVYLTWNFTAADTVEHYEIYWSTSEIVNVSAMVPNVNTNSRNITLDGLSLNETYYFAVVAVDLLGDHSGIAFSTAAPTEAAATPAGGEGGGHDDDDEEHEDVDMGEVMYWTFIIIIAIMAIMIVALAAGLQRQGKKD